MKRRDVIRNSLMALAVSFLPKILQPSVPEVMGDEPEYFKGFFWHIQNGGSVTYYTADESFCVDDMKSIFMDYVHGFI